MSFWLAGLANNSSARRAAKWGGIACMVEAARMTVGNLVLAIINGGDAVLAIAGFIGASLIPLFFALTGIRLWQGKGWIAGTIAALIPTLDFALFGLPHLNLYRPLPATISAIMVLVVRAIVSAFILNGVRGAFALRSNDSRIEERPSTAVR